MRMKCVEAGQSYLSQDTGHTLQLEWEEDESDNEGAGTPKWVLKDAKGCVLASQPKLSWITKLHGIVIT